MSSGIATMLVVAIDIGTDESGCAYSLLHDYKKNPDMIYSRTFVFGGLIHFKQPTCVLCNPDGLFHSFGYKAEEKYNELVIEDEHYKWYFFRKFTDMLSQKQVNLGFEITDEKGLKMPAIQVFSMAIRYLKDDLLDTLKSFLGMLLRENDVHWVLPVPANWTVSAKELLREAAIKAGIDGDYLTIALEPDGAAVYCELLPSIHILRGGRFDDDKYMVIHLGGRTSHFTVHERQPNGIIHLVQKVSSGPWGTTKVHEEFTQMIINIVGDQTFKMVCGENHPAHYYMLREVEIRQRKLKNDDQKIPINIPDDLSDIYEDITGKTVQDAIEQSPYKGKIHWRRGLMKLDAELFRSFFKTCISGITNHIEHLCQEPGFKGTSTFLMIGKLSECPLVQEAVIKALPKATVVVPHDPERAVLKGAVLLGHKFGRTWEYNYRLQQHMKKDHSTVATTLDLANQNEDDVSSDSYATGAACSSSATQSLQNNTVRTLKCQSLHDEGEYALSSDFVEMSIQTQDKDNTRAPSDDELFALSRKLNRHAKEWWLLAKLLGLSDKQIKKIEHTKGETHIVRQYYNMLTAWKRLNAGQEKGSVRYLLSKCDEAGINKTVRDNLFGN